MEHPVGRGGEKGNGSNSLNKTSDILNILPATPGMVTDLLEANIQLLDPNI